MKSAIVSPLDMKMIQRTLEANGCKTTLRLSGLEIGIAYEGRRILRALQTGPGEPHVVIFQDTDLARWEDKLPGLMAAAKTVEKLKREDKSRE